MRIIVVHNHYQLRGGEDESYQAETSMLCEAGHDVIRFTEHNNRVKKLGNVGTAMRAVWSQEAYRHTRDLIKANKADILHVQNFFPLISPSVYYAARAEGIPVVQSLRNYRLLCPNAIFFRDGQVCERCLGKLVPWPGVVHACYRGSSDATAVVTAMITIHRLAHTWTDQVDLYIALTEFARAKFIEGGLPSEKIVVKPNFVHPDPGAGEHRGGYALFVGRLSVEKGIPTLLRAWKHVGRGRRLLIVGEGPLEKTVREAEAAETGIEYLGRRPAREVYGLMADAELLILPSEWYETFGRVAVEAFGTGTPVIAANIGAVAELVDHERTGLLFAPGDAEDLAARLDWAWSHPHELRTMGSQARNEYETKYTAAVNYRRMMEIYALAASRAH
jgi:glycosyltransferase involved in cell wall biosynthesis